MRSERKETLYTHTRRDQQNHFFFLSLKDEILVAAADLPSNYQHTTVTRTGPDRNRNRQRQITTWRLWNATLHFECIQSQKCWKYTILICKWTNGIIVFIQIRSLNKSKGTVSFKKNRFQSFTIDWLTNIMAFEKLGSKSRLMHHFSIELFVGTSQYQFDSIFVGSIQIHKNRLNSYAINVVFGISMSVWIFQTSCTDQYKHSHTGNNLLSAHGIL